MHQTLQTPEEKLTVKERDVTHDMRAWYFFCGIKKRLLPQVDKVFEIDGVNHVWARHTRQLEPACEKIDKMRSGEKDGYEKSQY